ILAFALLFVCGTAVPQAAAQGKKSDSVVKIEAKADKPDADGNQVVTLTITIDKPYHIYANPVGYEDLSSVQTVVTFTKVKPEDLKVEYPPGKEINDAALNVSYKIYEDKVTIKATVKRAKGDTSPLEANVKLEACNDKGCLLPATVKVPVQ